MNNAISIRKNKREEIRISRNEYNGHDLINVRVFYDAGDEMRPGKQGLAFKSELLGDIINGLTSLSEIEGGGHA